MCNKGNYYRKWCDFAESLQGRRRRFLLRFAGRRTEEININEEYRKLYPEYTHRVLHIFTAKLEAKKKEPPTEMDFGMEESVWMPLEKLDDTVKTRPGCLKEILHRRAKADAPMYLGTEYIDRY